MTTSEVLLYRALDLPVDKNWVDWALTMLEAGHDTPHLRILAGELPPFNQFELLPIVDRTLEELGLDWSNRKIALENFTAELLERMLRKEIASSDALAILNDMYLEFMHLEFNDEGLVRDFYLLYWAQGDLLHADTQYYWPDTDRSNIEERIREQARSWIEEHRGKAEQAIATDADTQHR
jgi:hypothetical protein